MDELVFNFTKNQVVPGIPLINDENIWGTTIDLYGDAISVNGCAAELDGDISGFSGCCSCIAGDLKNISLFTTDLNEIHEIFDNFNRGVASVWFYFDDDHMAFSITLTSRSKEYFFYDVEYRKASLDELRNSYIKFNKRFKKEE